MNMQSVRRFAKRVLPSNVYSAIVRHAVGPVRSYKRRLLFSLRSYKRRLLFSLWPAFPRKYQYPSLLSIFLTTRCNLRCFICRREGFKGEDLKFENIYKLEKAIRYARTIDLTGWGEPFLYPRFEEVLNYIYSLNPRGELIQISTNGTRLSEHAAELLRGHLHLLVISLNAATAPTYNRDMEGGNFEDTLLRIRAFLSALEGKGRSKVLLHFVAHTENFREIPDFVVLANNLGISAVSIGQYLVGIPEHVRYSLLHVKQDYNAVVDRAQDLGTKLGVQVHARRFTQGQKARFSQECREPFDSCYITVSGDVAPCCFCGSYSTGNAYETSFEAVWFGDAYRKLREKRYLLACQKCMPFIPLDDYSAHFTAYFKETKEFKAIEQNFMPRREVDGQSEQERTMP